MTLPEGGLRLVGGQTARRVSRQRGSITEDRVAVAGALQVRPPLVERARAGKENVVVDGI